MGGLACQRLACAYLSLAAIACLAPGPHLMQPCIPWLREVDRAAAMASQLRRSTPGCSSTPADIWPDSWAWHHHVGLLGGDYNDMSTR